MLLGPGQVELAVENSSGGEVAAHVRLELIDPSNNVLTTVERDETIQPGTSNLLVPLRLPLPKAGVISPDQLLWYRLRYQVLPASNASRAINPVKSIIALSEIAPEIFNLQVAAPQYAREGALCRLHVRAQHPLTSRPVGGVSITGEITFSDGRKAVPLKASGLTGAEGYLTLDFNLPRDIPEEEGEVHIVASLGPLVQEVKEDLNIDRSARILLNTDKPLYQPGQVVHMRAIVLDPTRHAMPEESGTLTIEDEDQTTVFRTALKTSRFGIMSADWTAPSDMRLGDYLIKVRLDKDEETDAVAQGIKISRYDLPNFAVSVQPDQEYYLPGQAAEVEVRGEYLFGEQVKRGHARVVRETERTWNYSEQRWETHEGDKVEGDLDQDGRFVAHINLEKEQARLADSESRYFDLNYAAYLTDPTTNRTEQRRFDLRITKEAIHIYATEANYGQAQGLPLEFYLSTFYADGTPAPCEVIISEDASSESHHGATARASQNSAGQLLQRVRTNRFGVAHVKGPVIARQEEGDGEKKLVFVARDRRGKVGHTEQEFDISADTMIRVETDKTLYSAGDAVKVWLTSNQKDLTVILDVARDLQVIRSELVRLKDGHAFITLPESADFKDRLTIAASSAGTMKRDYDRNDTGRRVILFPRTRELKLDVQLDRDTYRPGEDATADVRVRTPDGRACESALGVVVLDKAVEERARTNQGFSSYGFYSSFNSFLYGDDNLSGITERELERLDLHHGVPEGVEVAADLLLQRAGSDYGMRNLSERRDYIDDERAVFYPLASTQLLPVNVALYAYSVQTTEHPLDQATLRRLLAARGIDFDALRDPWGIPYRAEFSVNRAYDVLEILSSGPDKRFDTKDDFYGLRISWPYFLKEGEKISRALAEYHARTGEYILHDATLKSELRLEGHDFDSWRDRWGRPYSLSLSVKGTFYWIEVRSSGPDGRFTTSTSYSPDDFTVWQMWEYYFAEVQTRIGAALAAYSRATAGRFPVKEAELRDALHQSGMEWENLRDPWEHPFYVDFRTEVQAIDLSSVNVPDREPQPAGIMPGTHLVSTIRLFSSGPDGRTGTSDDFIAASFKSTSYDPSTRHHQQRFGPAGASLPAGSGMIKGLVYDPVGAAVVGAKVTVVAASGASRETTTDDNGFFMVTNLASGFYSVRVDQAGFKSAVVERVEVRAGTANTVTVSLEIGDVSATVNVTDVAQIDQMSTAVEMNTSFIKEVQVKTGGFAPQYGRSNGGIVNIITKSGGEVEEGSTDPQSQISTPRLREYFPETLVWQPALETDAGGRAQLHFKLADNITTWKMSVIGSTIDGEVGMAETEFRAFQPFFIEHDPPRVLTEGDEINLPVVLRNYTDHAQAVDVELKPEDWFTLLDPAQRRAQIPAGDATRETFRFRAVSMVVDGRQRITATGSTESSDAVERAVSVHPDGQEIALTNTKIFTDEAALEADIPGGVVNGATHAEVKIYPNLMSHVVESIEGIMERPHGCGEQTISSTYPSLLVLQAYKRTGSAPPPAARRYTQAGYERLLNYRVESGGFTYWGRGEADTALTAYALKFLSDAAEFVAVDEDVIEGAHAWLVKQQGADGSWKDNPALTSFIARVLAQTASRQANTTTDARSKSSATVDPLARAFEYLSRRMDETKDPYLLASYALAALDAGRKAEALGAVGKLRALARSEGEASYWTNETSTPFHGWGLAGEIETTALAIRALERNRAPQQSTKEVGRKQATPPPQEAISDEPLIGRGLVFLLRNKDRYGVWLSTQATVNVLDTLIATTVTSVDQSTGGTAEVFVNGRLAGSVSMAGGDQFDNPLRLDVSRFISAGRNRVEIRRSSGASQASVHLVTTYWLPWSAPANDSSLGHAESNALRFTVAFDKTEARVGEEVTCRVSAARVGAYEYGMLLAEIGLPPGADVDRSSLESAMRGSNWGLSRYDILPDRLVVYLWPQRGGTRFEFKFRPRYGLAARTAPSVLYDYYNPDARRTVAPVKFMVQ
jgi:hypothetical protein